MHAELAAFLARYEPQAEETAVWGDGTLPLRIISYLGDDLPPRRYITSVRCLVFRDEQILVVRNRHSTHIVPGGRCEEKEALEETLAREVLEETGWTLGGTSLLGFMHFHHLAAKPPGYIYPHPDFVQVVYMAEADIFVPAAKLVDDYELEARFLPLTDLDQLTLTPAERVYLQAALERRARR